MSTCTSPLSFNCSVKAVKSGVLKSPNLAFSNCSKAFVPKCCSEGVLGTLIDGCPSACTLTCPRRLVDFIAKPLGPKAVLPLNALIFLLQTGLRGVRIASRPELKFVERKKIFRGNSMLDLGVMIKKQLFKYSECRTFAQTHPSSSPPTKQKA